jgi:hypothetical protein
MSEDFDGHWKKAVRFRHVSRELEPLLRELHVALTGALTGALPDPRATAAALEHLLSFLAGAGRTDANCTATYYFASNTEELWQSLPDGLRGILDDMSGTLQDSVHAENIARTFEATPEQLLERLKRAPV